MTRIPGYPYVAPQAEANDVRDDEVRLATPTDDTTMSEQTRTTEKDSVTRSSSTGLPVTTSRNGATPELSLEKEGTRGEAVTISGGSRLQGHHAMAIGFGFVLASIFF